MKITLGESVQSLEELLRFGGRGRNTERKAHIMLMRFMYNNLQQDFWSPKHRQLQKLFKQYAEDHLKKPTTTLCYWYRHFINYGKIMPDTELYRKQPNLRRSQWTTTMTTKLLAIVEEDPNLYLDEI